MTRVTPCDDCGDRERVGFQRDGICRECRGVDTPKRTIRSRTYVSPDTAERNSEALDHAEQQNRSRIVNNASNQTNGN